MLYGTLSRGVLFLILACAWSQRGFATETSSSLFVANDGHHILTVKEKSNVLSLPTITFYIRYPLGVKSGGAVDGIYSDVTYMTDPENLKKWIERSSDLDKNFAFADRHKLAVVTWTTDNVFPTVGTYDLQTDPDNPMERCYRAWRRAMQNITRTYGLPSDGYLMCGLSRGAEWAQRIALRAPEKFLAVHLHVNSSFAEPMPSGSQCLWLITTGEMEYGRQSAVDFYRQAILLNYPIMIRIYPNLGHADCAEQTELGVRFFEYALDLRKKRQQRLQAEHPDALQQKKFAQSEIIEKTELIDFKEAPYTGDMINGDVYPSQSSHLIPPSQRVAIPSKAIAEAWGYFHNN